VQEIRRGAERAAAVTRQLLTFSRKQVLEPRLFDLNDTVEAIARLLSRLIGPEIEVHTQLGDRSNPILGDPGQVEQAIVNLAVNARDAMPEGGTIAIRLDAVDVDKRNRAKYAGMPAGRYARIAVKDSGVGMDADLQRQIFEPFFTTKDPDKGTGLGLSIVYTIAKESGGTVMCTSAPGKGTTFEVLLPVTA